MYEIRTLNQIAPAGLGKLPAPEFIINETAQNPHAILLRSYELNEEELTDRLLAVARAGAGTNNIPVDACTQRGIPVFNTPGGNANAVKELVLAGLLLSSRRILEGSQWVQSLKDDPNVATTAEKGKKQFIGPEIAGKKLGVIGLGAIGVLVANAALDLGMEVIGYDPFLSLESAWQLSSAVEHAETIDEVVSQSDYITLHIPLNDDTKYTFNKEVFASAKKGMRLLNFARGELVELDALKEALADGTVSRYLVDFPMPELIGLDNVIVTPHLGASTPESEENCANMAATELREYLRYGNIKNSVNFPNCSVPHNGKPRVAISHKNIVNMIGSLGAVFNKHHINIHRMVNNSKGELAYNLIVCDNLHGKEKELEEDLRQINSVIQVRIIPGE